MKISIVIPVFNEITTIETLLDRVWRQPLDGHEKELVIVESNSTDGTREVVRRVVAATPTTESNSIVLVEQARALGKGNAVREGFSRASGEIILIQDGDLEYDVADYPALIEPIVSGRTDLVLGSRHLAASTWKIRKFVSNPVRAAFMNLGGIFFHGFFNLMFRQHLTDPTTMYKVFRRSSLQDFDLVCNRFDFDFELLGKLIRAGCSPLEVPISYVSRDFSEGKKVNVWRDPWTWVIAIVRARFSPMRAPRARTQAREPARAPE